MHIQTRADLHKAAHESCAGWSGEQAWKIHACGRDRHESESMTIRNIFLGYRFYNGKDRVDMTMPFLHMGNGEMGQQQHVAKPTASW